MIEEYEKSLEQLLATGVIVSYAYELFYTISDSNQDIIITNFDLMPELKLRFLQIFDIDTFNIKHSELFNVCYNCFLNEFECLFGLFKIYSQNNFIFKKILIPQKFEKINLPILTKKHIINIEEIDNTIDYDIDEN